MKRGYRFFWHLTRPIVSLIYPRVTHGRENFPHEGACLVCGNHSSGLDPFMVAYSIGIRSQIYFMSKAELFRVPVLGFFLKTAGMFPVDRKHGGAAAMKQAMKLLKSGEKVGIFPEGMRVMKEEESAAKAGAVRLAARMQVPIVPVYIPRKKKLFRKNHMVIGAPYVLALDKTASAEEFEAAADDLMRRIRELGEAFDA